MSVSRVGAGGDAFDQYRGKSSDTKPVDGVENGAEYYEMDTRKVFMFDIDDKVWIEQ